MPHGKIFQDVAETLGNTPLIRLNRLGAGLPGRIAVKHGGYNPYNSVKDRIGAAMIDDAVSNGRLKPGMVIVEPTSGNTGIGLAYVAAARGYRCIFTMPETMTLERRHLLRALGTRVVLTEGPKGMKGAIARAEEILARLGDRAWMPRQFENAANPAIHYRTTGPEIWADTRGELDVFVSGVGTGGTITGAPGYEDLRRGRPRQQRGRDRHHEATGSRGSHLCGDLQRVDHLGCASGRRPRRERRKADRLRHLRLRRALSLESGVHRAPGPRLLGS
jgi:cysteine synthase